MKGIRQQKEGGRALHKGYQINERLTLTGLVPDEEERPCEYMCVIGGGGMNGEAAGEVYIGVIKGRGW